MSTATGLFKSSLTRKYWMALTGLFLVTFLVVHLAGNLQLIWGTQEDFNAYSKFMTSFLPIKIVSYLLYASILLHAIDGFMLAKQNMDARPEKYAYNKPGVNSSWASRNMAVLGTVILVFLVIHMKSFWFEMHFGNLPYDAFGYKDLHTITVAAFKQSWYTLLYVISMGALAFHLMHGFQSAFQTLGVNHKTYTPLIKQSGVIISVAIPLLFAAIPVYIYLFH
jgi:succinate dehydrogenase / fumarate reductase cytochrome b subunit